MTLPKYTSGKIHNNIPFSQINLHTFRIVINSLIFCVLTFVSGFGKNDINYSHVCHKNCNISILSHVFLSNMTSGFMYKCHCHVCECFKKIKLSQNNMLLFYNICILNPWNRLLSIYTIVLKVLLNHLLFCLLILLSEGDLATKERDFWQF